MPGLAVGSSAVEDGCRENANGILLYPPLLYILTPVDDDNLNTNKFISPSSGAAVYVCRETTILGTSEYEIL